MIWKSSSLAVAALLAGALVSPARANILHVDDDGLDPFECEAAQFHTIAEALATANPGDEIRVCPGVYPEQVVLTQAIRLTGISFGSARPVIRPTALPASRPSLLGGNPVTGAIIVDNEFVRITNLEIDLSNVNVTTCLPFLTGVYLRRANGSVEKTRIENVAVAGNPSCESGVGLYVESGAVDEFLGNPVLLPARVIVRDLDVSGYQKAGLVGNGPRTVLIVKGGGATGLGATAGVVQYGYQVGFGAKGKIAQVSASGHRSLVTAKAAAGLLIFQADRVSFRKSDVSDGQEGVLCIGDRARVKKTSFSDMSGDGVVFLGDANLAAANLIERSSVAGVFIKGDRNTVRGGIMRDLGNGVWFQDGVGNKYGGVHFENVPLPAQGVYGGVRWDLGKASADPFSTACDTAADCDDSNSCTTDACDPASGHCSYTTLPAGTTCDDRNTCTTADVCNAAGACQGTLAPAGTGCDDGNSCTQVDTCNASGACIGTPSPVGVSCDDGNACTGPDTCAAGARCVGLPVTVGTTCDDANQCTANDACDAFGICRGAVAPIGSACDDGNECTIDQCDTAVCEGDPALDGTPCAGGTLACTAGVCS